MLLLRGKMKIADKNRAISERDLEQPGYQELQTFLTIDKGIEEVEVIRIGDRIPDGERSELEFEISQEVINLDALQRIASRGHLDGARRALVWKSNAEADSFACFVRLLSDSIDHFCQQLDNSSVGILATLAQLSELLKINDEELWQHLEISKVKVQFYAFRWITLLLTQEFEFHSITRIWDSLLSNPMGVQEMLLRICCAMLLNVRHELLNGDFASNLRLLQHYPQHDIENILDVAQKQTPQSLSPRPGYVIHAAD